MKLYESIKGYLKESTPLDKYPEEIRDALLDKGKVTTYYCNECKNYFEEPTSKITDLDILNGTASMFPDHHYYDNLSYCPYCDSLEIEEQKIDLDDLVDKYLDDSNNHDIIYDLFEKKCPDLVTSDTYPLEDYPDICFDLVKNVIFLGDTSFEPEYLNSADVAEYYGGK